MLVLDAPFTRPQLQQKPDAKEAKFECRGGERRTGGLDSTRPLLPLRNAPGGGGRDIDLGVKFTFLILSCFFEIVLAEVLQRLNECKERGMKT